MGRTLIGQAALLLLGSLGPALRASLVPALAAFAALTAAAALASGLDPDARGLNGGGPNGGGVALGVAVAAQRLVWLLAHCWTAVAWHRFVLLGERPGWLPRVPALAVGRTAAWMLAIGVPAALLALGLGLGVVVLLMDREHPFEALGFAALLLLQPWEAPGLALLLGGILLGSGLLGAWVALRASPVLPAAAVGRPLGLRRAWRSTAPAKGAVLLAALALLAAQLLVPVLLGQALAWPVREGVLQPLLAAGAPPAAVRLLEAALTLALGWPPAMLALAVVTTLHRRVAEPRPPA